jgi:hypothetical protein
VNDYIKREDVLRAIWKTSAEHDLFFPAIMLDAIKAIPAADVRPVVRGKWLPSDIPDSILDKCSECGFNTGSFTFHYCPNCGADMRVEQDE